MLIRGAKVGSVLLPCLIENLAKIEQSVGESVDSYRVNVRFHAGPVFRSIDIPLHISKASLSMYKLRPICTCDTLKKRIEQVFP